MGKNYNYFLVDYRAKKQIETLRKWGMKVIPVYTHQHLQQSISSHPDMLIYSICNQVIYAPGTSYNTLRNIQSLGFKIIEGATALTCNYPGDIAYNIARIGNKIFHNLKYTDSLLRNLLESYGFKFVHVNQGYTKCNICILGDKAAITEDKGIADVLEREGIDVLVIPPGNVRLSGYRNGFIGGASGLLSGDTLVFTGKLLNREVREKIEKFIEKHNLILKYLSDDEIIDIGSIISLNQE
ncbi:MAG: hypothetical protein QME46_03465 [Thermoanaerobacteraceae bacterium]|nr:hypothetical protein [Thermoanaerobacteraceae bacterium]